MRTYSLLMGVFLTLAGIAAPAQAYLLPLLSAGGLIGSTVLGGVIAVLSVAFLLFFHGRQVLRWIGRRKNTQKNVPKSDREDSSHEPPV